MPTANEITPSIRILYFGIYSKRPEYPRNNNILAGLRNEGIDVWEAQVEVKGSFQERLRVATKFTSAATFLFRLVVSYAKLTWKFFKAPMFDVVIIGHPGYFHIHLARILCHLFQRRARLVFDVFIPLYDAVVEDRHLFAATNPIAKALHSFEANCCKSADAYLIDSFAHRDYLSSEFKIPPERIHVLRVGPTIRDSYNAPADLPTGPLFKVLFVGTFIPLHGIDIILKAAKQLEDDHEIQFNIIGSGQLSDSISNLAKKLNLHNAVFETWVSVSELGEIIRRHHLSLGIFGTTPKAERVIPSKLYDACAAGVPIITSDTRAVQEVFTHLENAYLIPSGNPWALAEGIRALKTDPRLRQKLATGAFRLGQEEMGRVAVGKAMRTILSKTICQR